MGHCHKCNKQRHQAHECKTKNTSSQRFDHTAITIKSMDLGHMSVDPSPNGHKKRRQR